MHWAVAHHHALAELTITTTYPDTTTSFQGERKKVKVIFQWYKWYFNNNNLPPYNHKFSRKIRENDCSMTTFLTPYNHRLSRRIWGKLEKRKWRWYFNDTNLTPYSQFSGKFWGKLENKKVKVIFQWQQLNPIQPQVFEETLRQTWQKKGERDILMTPTEHHTTTSFQYKPPEKGKYKKTELRYPLGLSENVKMKILKQVTYFLL